ncbi:MAG: phenylalanine--tRNA ligase subunit beta [Thermoplasmata archaeon]|nr:phenylalanine--tRNA ligase subunit beta [Thermoplasmata archaeon]
MEDRDCRYPQIYLACTDLQAYASVLEGKKRYPLIVDRDGTVLSFPPIINGITTAITEDTKDIFVDCTGTDINAVKAAVNILTTALAERGAKIRTVRIHQDGKTALAPDLAPARMTIDPGYVNSWIGTSLTPDQMVGCLKRLGHGASVSGPGIEVLAPRYRADILHAVDIAEDVAIGHGFERFGNILPKHATFGRTDPLTEYGDKVKPIMIGLGYFEVVTLTLSNPRDQYEALNLPLDETALRVKNPVSEEHSLVRTSLLPSLMIVLRKNKHRELPQRLFEVGNVVTKGKNRLMMSAAAIHAKAGFTEVKSVVQSVISGMGFTPEIMQGSHPAFVSGRCAELHVGGKRIGVFGEVTPATIEAFELRYPVTALEIDLEALFAMRADAKASAPCA